MSNDEPHNYEVGRLAAEIDAEAQRARKFRRMDFWTPYPKQLEVYAATKEHREVGFFAANQVGKSESLSFLDAYHLTGLYPQDFPGHRFKRPTTGAAICENLKMTRDILQRKLLGPPGSLEEQGTGCIPKDLIISTTLARGEGDALDSVKVRHVPSGGVSTLYFRTYGAGRSALQGLTLDFVHMDEEPEDDSVYSELLARVTATRGRVYIGFTPLKGMSGISLRFRQEFSPDRTYVQMGINDVPVEGGHIPPALRETIIAGYPEHEREARSQGVPMLGEGRIYSAPEDAIVEDENPLRWPLHWRWGWAIDLGISHPFAAVLMCHDVDMDRLHVVAEVRMAGATPPEHVAAMREVEKRIFRKHMDFWVAYPHDAGVRNRSDGQPMRELYKRFGLRMMDEHATHADQKGAAATSLEAGILEINVRERGGAWKVARGCLAYLEERRLYHRKNGEPVDVRDDVLAAARYGMMMRRRFRPLDESGGGVPGTPAWSSMLRKQADIGRRFAKGSPNHSGGDIDVFTGAPLRG
jgi:phage terminase large subunit-like protein